MRAMSNTFPYIGMVVGSPRIKTYPWPVFKVKIISVV